jgi:hypothetical protein
MKITLGATILLSLLAATAWACTVQTEDDSVPGDGHGWGGLYYSYTPFTGYLVNGKHEDFTGTDDSIISHSLVAEGVVGFCKDFYAKVDIPYSSTTSKLTETIYGLQAETITTENTVSGLGDAAVAFKWIFLNPDEGPRAGVLVGASLPTGDEDKGLGSGVASPNLMLVGGIPAGWENRLYGSVNSVYTPQSDAGAAGLAINYTLSYDFCVGSGVTFPLEVLGSYELESSSGGFAMDLFRSHFLSVSPAVTYTPIAWATICAGVIVPVLKQGYADDYDYSPHLTFFYNF